MLSLRLCAVAFAVALAFPAVAHAGRDTPGVLAGDTWSLADGSGFDFGAPGDVAVVGDWDGDGVDTAGVFNSGTWTLADGTTFSLGQAGDTPVAGDWDGDGIDTPAVFHDGAWAFSDGTTLSLGQAGDTPVAGDWDGDGIDTPAVFHDGTWAFSDGTTLSLGQAGDTPVAGDWDGDGLDTPAVFHDGTWTFADGTTLAFGAAGDEPFAGDWQGPTVAADEAAAPCTGGRIITYNQVGWTTLLNAFAANPATCTDYYIDLPPLAGNKTQPRSGDALTTVRSKGPNFHPVAEFNWAAWQKVTGMTWYQKGVEFRRRMNRAGYDQTHQETWAVNELPSAVRTDPAVRRAARDLVRGLYRGPNGHALGGAVFVINMGHGTTNITPYKTHMKDWTLDSAFWKDMDRYVRWWGQEVYTSCQYVCLPDATVAERSKEVNDFIEHPAKLAAAGPAGATAARSFFNQSYTPLVTAYWNDTTGYGKNDITLGQMEGLVSLETYAAKAWSASHVYPDRRLAFAWNESPAGATPEQTQALAARVAAAVAGAYSSGGTAARACSPSGDLAGCSPSLEGAAPNNAWDTFGTW